MLVRMNDTYDSDATAGTMATTGPSAKTTSATDASPADKTPSARQATSASTTAPKASKGPATPKTSKTTKVAKPAPRTEDGLKPVSAKSRNITIVATVIALIVVFLALGFFVHWGLAAIFAIIMVPGAISMAIIARHPEKTGGRSMLGVSNPDTLLEPFTGKRK